MTNYNKNTTNYRSKIIILVLVAILFDPYYLKSWLLFLKILQRHLKLSHNKYLCFCTVFWFNWLLGQKYWKWRKGIMGKWREHKLQIEGLGSHSVFTGTQPRVVINFLILHFLLWKRSSEYCAILTFWNSHCRSSSHR